MPTRFEARELTRDCLRQIAVHHPSAEARFCADAALDHLTPYALYKVMCYVSDDVFDKVAGHLYDCCKAGAFDAQ